MVDLFFDIPSVNVLPIAHIECDHHFICEYSGEKKTKLVFGLCSHLILVTTILKCKKSTEIIYSLTTDTESPFGFLHASIINVWKDFITAFASNDNITFYEHWVNKWFKPKQIIFKWSWRRKKKRFFFRYFWGVD